MHYCLNEELISNLKRNQSLSNAVQLFFTVEYIFIVFGIERSTAIYFIGK